MSCHQRPLLFACLMVLLAALGSAQDEAKKLAPATASSPAMGKPIVVGHERTIDSKLLGETRTLRVALPRNYAESDKPSGVLYLLDGESLFLQAVGANRHLSEGDVLPMIVVGIDNTERTRDLTPPAGATQTTDFPTSGGSALFRRFLIDEVRPFIDAEYRTGPVRVLAGHSFGGLFTAETLLVEPASFTGFLVLSPSFWWNDRAFVEEFESVASDHGMFDRFAYFSMGEEDGLMNGPFEEVTWALKNRAPSRFRWKHQVFPHQDHWPAALPALGAGIKEFYAPIRELGEGVSTFAELEQNANAASAMFGQTIPIGRNAVASAARRLGLQGNTNAALALVDAAMEKVPTEPYYFYVRADLLDRDERYAEAIAMLERGIELFSGDEKHSMPVSWMKQSLMSFKRKVKGK